MKDAIQILKELESLSPYMDQRKSAEIRQDANNYVRNASSNELNSLLGMMIRNRMK